MKKLFIVLAVATLGFVACNSEGDKTDTTDTTTVAPDTTTMPAPAPMDTTHMDTTVKDTSAAK